MAGKKVVGEVGSVRSQTRWCVFSTLQRQQMVSLLTNEKIKRCNLRLPKRELKKLIGKLREKGLALIPLKIYFIANGKAKIELGLARGKKLYDKRASLKEKQSNRDLQRAMRHNSL